LNEIIAKFSSSLGELCSIVHGQQDGSENTFVPFGLRQAQTNKGTKDCSVQPELKLKNILS